MTPRSLLIAATMCAAFPAASESLIYTDYYVWNGDSIIQGPFKAYAPNDSTIVTNYSAQPGYFMPPENGWTLKNDIRKYPRMHSSNRLHNAVYTLALDEMVNAVEPDTTLRTGREWAGVWTRDVSYSIMLAMAYMQPEASRISLEKKITPEGRIVQDTGSGGAWPISSDRLIWLPAAYELYKVTGDKAWAKKAYEVGVNTLSDDALTVVTADGRVRGETSFIDWREQSYPKWMQPADIYSSAAMSTTTVAASARDAMAGLALALGKKHEAERWRNGADLLRKAINQDFWIEDKGHYGMYRYGRIYPILHPAAEALGQSLAILNGVASPEQAVRLTQKSPVTPFGVPVFAPEIKDMGSYHNKALWPFVASFWTLANAKADNEEGVMQGLASIVRPAALFATNKENLRIDNGDVATELNSSNMLWSLSGNIALTVRMLFGVNFEPDGLMIKPYVPKAMADTRTLEGLEWRGLRINIKVSGFGSEVKSMTVDGKFVAPGTLLTTKMLHDGSTIDVVMADNKSVNSGVNMAKGAAVMPLMPIARLINDPDMTLDAGPTENLLVWNPIEYAAGYDVLRNGEKVATTRRTSWLANAPGEWQVVSIDADGNKSFASEPLTNFYELRAEPSCVAKEMVSNEVSYQPDSAPEGWTGTGYAETDHSNPVVKIPFATDVSGRWTVGVRYANGNGPVNTENKAAIRTLFIDGQRIGTIVMPQRGVGNWDDWGTSNILTVDLPAGDHTAVIELRLPENENMNRLTNHALIDCIELKLLPAGSF